jgi:hexosaminidase
MNKVFLILLIVIANFAYGQDYTIIPLPNRIEKGIEKFEIKDAKYLIRSGDRSWQSIIPHIPLALNNMGKKQIIVELVFDNRDGEGYDLTIAKEYITIAGNDKGCYYGLQSFSQLIVNNDSIYTGKIIDKPRFVYRGMHLDVCRHFFTVAEVKQYLDWMARYKFNTFHWHLTEDQGWRIEIKKYPLLTTIGSIRKNTLIGKQTDEKGTGEYDTEIESGFYTQEEIKDIVQYAWQRKIEIIPEIELPGHSLAAIASYPWLGCKNEARKVGSRWGVYDDVYCAGNDSVFIFLQDVLTEVMVLFPGKYIHIGGDEVVKTNWKTCKKCQTRMTNNNLKNENELQSYFIGRIDKFLTKKERIPIGWDEILEGGLAPHATVMSWRGEQGGIEAAKQQHDVIMTPGSHCYFDHSQNKKQDEPLNIGGNTSYQKVYNYNPIPKEIAKENEHFVLGAQANLWTEYITNWDKLCYMAMPRMQALSEVLWTMPAQKNIINFEERLGKESAYLESKHIGYRIPEPNGWMDSISNASITSLQLNSINNEDELFYYWKKNKQLSKMPIEIEPSKKDRILHCYLQNKITKRKSIVYKSVILKQP